MLIDTKAKESMETDLAECIGIDNLKSIMKGEQHE